MTKNLTNRHATALDLLKTSNVTLKDMCGHLLAAIEDARREGVEPQSDPAVRLIAARLSKIADVTDANCFGLIQECERRLAEFVSRPRLLQIVEAPVTSSAERKQAFHREVARLLREVAIHLGLRPGAYDIRSNKAGPAVSGEVTMHGDQVYVQVSQSSFVGQEILFRRCDGRTDYTGGMNHFAPIATLCEPASLARRIKRELRLTDDGSSGQG